MICTLCDRQICDEADEQIPGVLEYAWRGHQALYSCNGHWCFTTPVYQEGTALYHTPYTANADTMATAYLDMARRLREYRFQWHTDELRPRRTVVHTTENDQRNAMLRLEQAERPRWEDILRRTGR